MRRRLLSIILVVLLVSSLIPVSVNAVSSSEFVNYARTFKGVPYVIGGRSPSGFDCCGFVWYVCNHFGIDIGTGNQTSQINYGTPIAFENSGYLDVINNMQIGDLLFFDYGSDGSSDHVAIYTGNGNIINAENGGVLEHSLDQGGWPDGKMWESLCAIRRVLSTTPHASHDKGTYMYYEATHPHRNCYKCSVCGTIWADDNSSNIIDSCDQCAKAEATTVSTDKTVYTLGETVTITPSATNIDHFTIRICYGTYGEDTTVYSDFVGFVGSKTYTPTDIGKYIVRISAVGSSGEYIDAECTFEVINNASPTIGWQKINSKWYFFDKDGDMIKSCWVKSNGKWYYMDKTGAMVVGWLKKDGKWYYFSDSGAMKTGWLKYDGKWYYFSDSGAMKTGWLKYDGKWYYLNEAGLMKTGLTKVNDKWYYLNGSGVMQTGWVLIENKWYYMSASGAMQFGWIKVNNKWYFMDAVGVMQTGWTKVNADWYYMNSSGAMQTGWVLINDNWYFFNGSGVMVTGEQVINGKTQLFDNYGVWLGQIN